jgi:hypothetical protein
MMSLTGDDVRFNSFRGDVLWDKLQELALAAEKAKPPQDPWDLT